MGLFSGPPFEQVQTTKKLLISHTTTSDLQESYQSLNNMRAELILLFLGLAAFASVDSTPLGGGLTAPKELSPELADIVGTKVASRAMLMKLLWTYIKKNNLQDPDNKQYLIPDKKMAKVFGSEKMRGFGMAKHIGPHLS